jgi:hypothetical protein
MIANQAGCLPGETGTDTKSAFVDFSGVWFYDCQNNKINLL